MEVRSKRSITGSMKQALKQSDVVPIIAAAKEAGAFDDAYIGYPDKRMLALHEMPARLRPDRTALVCAGGECRCAGADGAVCRRHYRQTGGDVCRSGWAARATSRRWSVRTCSSTMWVRNVAGIKPTPDSFAFIVGKDGVIITHPNKELALKPVSALDQSLTPQSLGGDRPARRRGEDQWCAALVVRAGD